MSHISKRKKAMSRSPKSHDPVIIIEVQTHEQAWKASVIPNLPHDTAIELLGRLMEGRSVPRIISVLGRLNKVPTYIMDGCALVAIANPSFILGREVLERHPGTPRRPEIIHMFCQKGQRAARALRSWLEFDEREIESLCDAVLAIRYKKPRAYSARTILERRISISEKYRTQLFKYALDDDYCQHLLSADSAIAPTLTSDERKAVLAQLRARPKAAAETLRDHGGKYAASLSDDEARTLIEPAVRYLKEHMDDYPHEVLATAIRNNSRAASLLSPEQYDSLRPHYSR